MRRSSEQLKCWNLESEEKKVGQVTRNFIAQVGFGKHFPHLTDYGLGLKDHKASLLDKGSKIELIPGMVLTVESRIYSLGVGVARMEDMIMLAEDRYKNLTKVKKRAYIIKCSK